MFTGGVRGFDPWPLSAQGHDLNQLSTGGGLEGSQLLPQKRGTRLGLPLGQKIEP